CGQCGQENEATPVSFAGLLREGWDEFIKVDKKLLATLGKLLFRPGYLTEEYVRGRRTAYLSPFKMYITVSALFFLVWGLIVPFDRVEEETARIASDIQQGMADGEKDAKAGSRKKGSISIQVNGKTVPAKNGPVKTWNMMREKPLQFFGNRIQWKDLPETVAEYRAEESKKSAATRDKPILHYLKERLIRFGNNPADSAKSLFSNGLPFLLLVQLPLFAIWMRLIYFRQRRLYVEHLVFVLHTHTFFFLLFGGVFAANALAQSLGTRLPMLDIPVTWLMLTGIVTFYNVLGYKRFYGQGWGKTLVKGWFLLHGYLFLFAFTFSIATLFAILWTLFAPG
ncbi:MAG: DUF3667 domain-containing protein, partial [Fibrella sp.]|nr:DUF3667 domain-containing protein [Armatimonadota bacterium]